MHTISLYIIASAFYTIITNAIQEVTIYSFAFDSLDWSEDVGSYDSKTHTFDPIVWYAWNGDYTHCPRYKTGERSLAAATCLRTFMDATVSRTISLVGYYSIRLQIDVNPRAVEPPHKWCILQYRTAATNWVNVNIVQGQDDMPVLDFDITIPDTNAYNNQASFEIKVGIAATSGGDSCLIGNLRVFGTPYYTDDPTKEPSLNPSHNPTTFPTKNPSIVPTQTPSDNPSVNPSIVPTQNPSIVPTQTPSDNPSVNPSIVPTQNPFIIPTQNPSVVDTRSPTFYPTKSPTRKPSMKPSMNPTKNPQDIPFQSTVSPPKNKNVSNESDVSGWILVILMVATVTFCLCIALLVLLLCQNRRAGKIASYVIDNKPMNTVASASAANTKVELAQTSLNLPSNLHHPLPSGEMGSPTEVVAVDIYGNPLETPDGATTVGATNLKEMDTYGNPLETPDGDTNLDVQNGEESQSLHVRDEGN
eukprot:336798_1